MRANLEAFARRRLRPRMLTGNATRDLSVEVLDTRSAGPFLLELLGCPRLPAGCGERPLVTSGQVDARLIRAAFEARLHGGDAIPGARSAA